MFGSDNGSIELITVLFVNLFVMVTRDIPIFTISLVLFIHHRSQDIIKPWLIPRSPSCVTGSRKVSIEIGGDNLYMHPRSKQTSITVLERLAMHD